MGTHSLKRHRRRSRRSLAVATALLGVGLLSAACQPDNGTSWDAPGAPRVTPTPAGAASNDLGIALCGADGIGDHFHATVRAFNHGNVTYDYSFTVQWLVDGTIEETADGEINGVDPKTSKDGEVTSPGTATQTANVRCQIKNAHRSG